MLYVAYCVIVYFEGCGRKCPWPNLMYWPGFYHKGLGKTTENPGQYDLSVDQDLNPPKYNAGVLPIHTVVVLVKMSCH
jgi:hypothetical protein